MSFDAPPSKFSDPFITSDGSTRASVKLNQLQTLWFNTGTLCNLACTNCYIESTPSVMIASNIFASREVQQYLDEIQTGQSSHR